MVSSRAEIYFKKPFLAYRVRFLIFFVTYKCNSRCRTCFYWRQLQSDESELTLEEIKKISNSLGFIPNLLISGGEPTLRPDLGEIIEIFYRSNGIRSMNIPTNGLLPEKTAELARNLSRHCPELNYSLSISLDGPEEVHDSIRGVNGGFAKAIKTIRLLQSLREEGVRFRLYVETVVSTENIASLPALIRFVKEELSVDNHYFEVLRTERKDHSLQTPSAEEYRKFVRRIMENHRESFFRKPSVEQFYNMGRTYSLYRTQLNVLKGNKLPFVCLAGRIAAVLEPNGEVRLCEPLSPVGNVRDFDYNLYRVLESDAAKEQLEYIANTRCTCTHCVFLSESQSYHPLTAFFRVPWYALKTLLGIKGI